MSIRLWQMAALCLFLSFQTGLFAIQEHWTRELPKKRLFDEPEPFEKYYVSSDQILCMQDGIYLKLDDCKVEKVQALREDCKGLYVVRFKVQCPLCGACYDHKHVPDDMGCPLYETEVFPNMWGVP